MGDVDVIVGVNRVFRNANCSVQLMAHLISKNLIQRLCESNGTDRPEEACFQVLMVKPMDDRYRLILSDTVHYTHSALPVSLNHLVESNKIHKGCLVNVGKLNIFPPINERKFYLFRLDEIKVVPLNEQLPKLGEPKIYSPSNLSLKQQSITEPKESNIHHEKKYEHPFSETNEEQKSNDNVAGLTLIESLSPYQNIWTIRARVISKSDIKTWSKQNSEGKLFSLTLMDESAEIRAVAFGPEVDQFFDIIQEGNVYLISKAKVNLSKKEFTQVKHDYQIQFDRQTEVTHCTEPSVFPKIKYDFVKLKDLENIPKDGICDVLGVITEIGDLGQVTSKNTNKAVTKRTMMIVDDSGYTTQLTLWGKQAESSKYFLGEVLAIKGVKVSDFNGRSISALYSSLLEEDPRNAEANILRGWYNQNRQEAKFQDHSSVVPKKAEDNIKEIKQLEYVTKLQDNLSTFTEGYYDFKATIIYIKTDKSIYPACPDCKRKIVMNTDGSANCDACNKQIGLPMYRYLLLLNVADATSTAWFTAFDEVGKLIMGIDANALMEIKNNSQSEYEEYFNRAKLQTFLLHSKLKVEDYNGRNTLKNIILSAKPINFVAQSKKLIDLIDGYKN